MVLKEMYLRWMMFLETPPPRAEVKAPLPRPKLEEPPKAEVKASTPRLKSEELKRMIEASSGPMEIIPRSGDPKYPVLTCRFCGKEVKNTPKRRRRHFDTCTGTMDHAYRIEALKISKLEAEFRRREEQARQKQQGADKQLFLLLRSDLIEFTKTRVATPRLLKWLKGGK